jgi:hypothetical protein
MLAPRNGLQNTAARRRTLGGRKHRSGVEAAGHRATVRLDLIKHFCKGTEVYFRSASAWSVDPSLKKV